MLDALQERVKNAVSLINTPERTMRRFARNWADKANALSVGDFNKAGLGAALKKIQDGMKLGDKNMLLAGFKESEGMAKKLLDKEMSTQKAEIFMLDKYLSYFNNEVDKVRNEMRASNVDRNTVIEVETCIHEIYRFFKKSIDYMISFEKNLAFQRTQMLTMRLATDLHEQREISFTLDRQRALDSQEHRAFKEIHKILAELKTANSKDVLRLKAELIAKFKELKSEYEKAGEMEKKYIYDIITRVENSLFVVNSFGTKAVEKLKAMKLDQEALTYIERLFSELFPRVKDEAKRDWELAKSALAKVKA